jgi:hypothetical protein
MLEQLERRFREAAPEVEYCTLRFVNQRDETVTVRQGVLQPVRTSEDVGAMITGSMTAVHPDAPYTFVAGNLVHFANGIVLALLWVAFLQERVPGNWIVQGLVYALITQLGAWVVVAPLAFDAGLFFTNTPAPGRMMLATASTHVAYGLSLTLSLKVAGVRAATAANRGPSVGQTKEEA